MQSSSRQNLITIGLAYLGFLSLGMTGLLGLAWPSMQGEYNLSLADQGAIFVVDSTDEIVRIVNLLAPEHASLALRDARALAPQITTAGAVFIGAHTPESVGDYIAGPSHVLPTGGSARFASPLGVSDFIKRTSIIEYDATALAAQADDIERLTTVEALEGHGRAVTIRTRGER